MVAMSNGICVKGNKPDKGKQKHLQRKLSRSKKGSNTWKKRRLQVGKESQRLKERRHGELHELSTAIVKEFSSNIVVEDLQIRNMTAKGGSRKKGLNRSVLEQNWGELVSMLSYKAESAGGYVKKVAPHYTSQTCSSCLNRREKKLELHERVFRCSVCGHEEDRDVNAAKNILRAGDVGRQGGRPAVPGRIEIQDGHGEVNFFAERLTGQNRMRCNNCI